MEMEPDFSRAKVVFDHPNNITMGHARVIWAAACHPIGCSPIPDGWALPGGERTTDSGRALQVATAMDASFKR